ncbi:hypothetical protein EI94DRAFT_1193810 [Lactarius quietus]|nr:hypothetical protein EI94DRAFT_1193810 [Lactarius quietus]
MAGKFDPNQAQNLVETYWNLLEKIPPRQLKLTRSPLKYSHSMGMLVPKDLYSFDSTAFQMLQGPKKTTDLRVKHVGLLTFMVQYLLQKR